MRKHGLVCVLTDRVTARVLDAARDLKVVANIAVGYDNIDVAAARGRGVVVTNTPDVLTEATAELTWALILAVTRRIAEGDRLVRAARGRAGRSTSCSAWSCAASSSGSSAEGGSAGRSRPRPPAFGMQAVFATRGARTPDLPEVSLDELLVSSDVVSIHAPLTATNRHLIDRAHARADEAVRVPRQHGARAVVDEEALAWALKEHLIAGAALDVYEREPAVHPALLELENVVLAPHLGSATRETRTAMAELAVRNVLAVLHGQPALTPVG